MRLSSSDLSICATAATLKASKSSSKNFSKSFAPLSFCSISSATFETTAALISLNHSSSGLRQAGFAIHFDSLMIQNRINRIIIKMNHDWPNLDSHFDSPNLDSHFDSDLKHDLRVNQDSQRIKSNQN